jgi:hypothetical protein
MTVADLPPILSPELAAQLLDCQPGTIEDRCRDGTLPGTKWGTGWVLPTAAFLQRVNEIALEESARLRERPAPRAVVSLSAAAAKGRRQPPQLPDLRLSDHEREYLNSACTEDLCTLCLTPPELRKPGQRHAGRTMFATPGEGQRHPPTLQ